MTTSAGASEEVSAFTDPMTIMDQSGDYLTATAVATVLGLSQAQVIARVRSGAIPALPPIVIPRAVLGIPRDAPVPASRCGARALSLRALPLPAVANPVGPVSGIHRPRRHWALRLMGRGVRGLVRMLVFLAVFVWLFITVLSAVTEPWSWFIGGQFTPYGHWHGVGTLTTDRGPLFALSLDMHGNSCTRRSCPNISGQADLCTAQGEIVHYALRGDSHVWLKSDGSNPVFALARRPVPDRLHHGDLTLGGHWEGGTLQIGDPLDSFGQSFTADGTPFTGDASNHPHVAIGGGLIRGSNTDFQRACRQLAVPTVAHMPSTRTKETNQ